MARLFLDDSTREVLTNPLLSEYNATIPQYTMLGLKMKEKGYRLKEIPTTFKEACKFIGGCDGNEVK